MTCYIYDNEDILLELDGSNNITARYTHGPGIDEPLVIEKGGASFFYHADGLGSITEITDATGVVKQQYTYSSFGKIESQLDPNFIQPYTFTAREFDPETGLYFYRARTYNPSSGRFLQEDPVRFGGGINFYRYVFNNPTNLADPTGEIVPVIVAGALFGAAINTGATVFSSVLRGEEITLGQVAGAFVSGAISGAVGSVAGPAAGTFAKLATGRALTGIGAILGTGAIAGIGGAGGEFIGAGVEALICGALLTSNGPIGERLPASLPEPSEGRLRRQYSRPQVKGPS